MMPTPLRPKPDAERRSRLWRRCAWVGAALALLLVFAAYRQPEMVADMARQLWSCFG